MVEMVEMGEGMSWYALLGQRVDPGSLLKRTIPTLGSPFVPVRLYRSATPSYFTYFPYKRQTVWNILLRSTMTTGLLRSAMVRVRVSQQDLLR